MEEVLEAVKEIEDKFLKINVEVPHSAIKKQMELFYIDYKVPILDAKSSVITYFLKEYKIDKSKFFGSTKEVTITKIEDICDGDWVNLKVKVVQLWEKTHESISQVGLISDETGIVKFTKWNSANISNIEVGKVYKFNNVIVNEWKEKFQIGLNKNSQVFEIDEDIIIQKNTISFNGALLHIQSGSGLIKRCLECNRALDKGICSIHGKSIGEYDLRIKAVFDDGIKTVDCIINRELTEKISNIQLDKAIEIASISLDVGDVLEQIKQTVCGRYYSIEGYMLDGKLIAESIKHITEIAHNEDLCMDNNAELELIKN